MASRTCVACDSRRVAAGLFARVYHRDHARLLPIAFPVHYLTHVVHDLYWLHLQTISPPSVVLVFLQTMDRASGSGKAKVRAEYLRFFEALGVVETAKIHTLGRLLHTFCEVATQLDSHLASVGATLHAAVSRMTETDNAAAPPRHRWIRIIDRLGFFPDHDQHASRIINMGLADAYRHKEVDLVTAANALHLCSQRLPCTCNGGSGTGATSPEVVPLGGITAPRTGGLAGARPPFKGVATTPTAGALGTPAPHFTGASVGSSEAGAGADADADDNLVLPPGGLIVPRPGALSSAEATDAGVSGDGGDAAKHPHDEHEPAAAAADGSYLQDGGIVVVRRQGPPGDDPLEAVLATMGAPATADARLSDGQALAVVAVDEPQTKVVLTTKPVIVPSPAAVKCILAVLNGLMDRSDAREVLYTLLRDFLLCFNRLHGGEADNCLPGEVEISTELAWTKVRTHLYRWWPIWRAPVGELAPFPVPGTVGFMSHPTRIGRVSRWALEVDMACVSETIKRLPVRSSILGGLPPVVSVTRIGPSVRSSLPLSVATLLLVASKEDRFCDVLTELATVGRAPAKKDCPIVVATCHDFETAELGALGETQPGDLSLPVRSEVRLAEDKDDAGELDEVADGLDVSAQESTPSQAAEREHRYAEMDVLLVWQY